MIVDGSRGYSHPFGAAQCRLRDNPLARCLAVAVFLGLATAASANLLSNPDFSQWDNDSTPSAWTVEARAYASARREAGQGHAEPPCLKLTRLQAGTGNNKGVLQNVPVTAGMAYTVSAWLTTPTMPDTTQFVSGRVIVTWRNASGAAIGSTNPSYLHEPVWTNQTYVVTAPNNPNGDSVATTADVLVRCYGRAGGSPGGILYVDDVSFEEGGAVAEPANAPRVRERLHVGPNPTRDRVAVRLELARATDISLRVYDLAGELRAKLLSGTLPAGLHSFSLPVVDSDQRPLPDGLYFLVLNGVGGERAVRKLVIRP